MANKYVVYKHTFPNGKVYIGITGSKNINNRWLSNGSKYKEQPIMLNAIMKFGWINVIHEIIESDLSKKEAYEKEAYYIDLYKSTDIEFGYNVSKGAKYYPYEKFHKGKVKTDEQKQAQYKKSSESMKLAWKNPEIRERIIKRKK